LNDEIFDSKTLTNEAFINEIQSTLNSGCKIELILNVLTFSEFNWDPDSLENFINWSAEFTDAGSIEHNMLFKCYN